jgi:hypothetical protein
VIDVNVNRGRTGCNLNLERVHPRWLLDNRVDIGDMLGRLLYGARDARRPFKG